MTRLPYETMLKFSRQPEKSGANPEPQNEAERMRAVESLFLLDTPPEFEFDEAVKLAAQICETPIGLISIVDHHRQWFKAKIGLDIDETPRDQAFCAHTIAGTEPLIVNNALEDSRFEKNPFVTGEPGIRFYAGMPLCTRTGLTIGTLCVIDTVPRELTAEQISALTVLGRQISMQIELRTRVKLMDELIEKNHRIEEELRLVNERLTELALTDGLTRLRNRRAFEERFDRELVLATEGTAPLSLILLDIDYFKSFNDDFGHSVGDDILCTVARILVKTCRTIDLVARHGGEEFAILLPNTSRDAAIVCAERLRSAVEAYPWAERKVTISLGVAAWAPHMAHKMMLFQAADISLYTAKSLGRNRIACHEDSRAESSMVA